LIANCYRHREMSDITTYLNDNDQTPLGRFVVYMLYDELCSKYGDKSNEGAYALVYHSYTVDPSKVRQTARWCIVCLIDRS